MRRFFTFFYIVCIFFAAVLLFAPPLIVRAAKKSIAGAVPGARISIKACRLWPWGTCTFSKVEIQRPGMYRVSIPSITAQLGFSGSIRIPDCVFDVRTARGQVQATAALRLSKWGAGIEEISLNAPAMNFAGVSVANGSLHAAAGRTGTLAIEQVSVGKLVMRNVTADTGLDGRAVCFENLSARLFDGSITGSGRIFLSAGFAYEAEMLISLVDMAAAVSGFGLTEKLELSGRAGGVAHIRGSAAEALRISGSLHAGSPGGVLNIRDQAVIDMIAKRSGQARDLISRSFTDYRYDEAEARVHTEQDELVLNIEFHGGGGTRALQAVLHDFTVQGGGK